MKMGKLTLSAFVLASLLCANSSASDEVLTIKNTTLNLIDALVQDGVISQERADELIEQAEKDAMTQLKKQERDQSAPPEKVIRVPYVPEFVKDQIREEVKSELREDVVEAVMSQAKNERWGVPGSTPEWISRIKVSGDVRLRAEGEMYGSDNKQLTSALAYWDFNDINNGGDGLLDLSEDRQRMRMRARLKIAAKIVQGLKAEFRIATGSTSDPVSLNETLGDYFVSDSIVLDRAYLQYDRYNFDGFNWLTLSGGRMPNPFLATDLVWDSDLNFEGAFGTLRFDVSGGGNDLLSSDEQNRTLSFTLGAFPLQEVKLSEKDKWLFSAEVGMKFVSDSQSEFEIAIAYHDYHNIEGERNTTGSTLNDFTAPEFMQGGNTLYGISNPEVPGSEVIPSKLGLASDYDLVNITMKYDIANFSPMHIIIEADYVKNIGYDGEEVSDRVSFDGGGTFVNSSLKVDDPEEDQTEGYALEVTYGWPNVAARGNWQVALGYKYLERDAVLDAFTDSDFFIFGTNAKGWRLSGSYGINENFWISAKYQSAVALDGFDDGTIVDGDIDLADFDLSRNLVQLDINAKF